MYVKIAIMNDLNSRADREARNGIGKTKDAQMNVRAPAGGRERHFERTLVSCSPVFNCLVVSCLVFVEPDSSDGRLPAARHVFKSGCGWVLLWRFPTACFMCTCVGVGGIGPRGGIFGPHGGLQGKQAEVSSGSALLRKGESQF